MPDTFNRERKGAPASQANRLASADHHEDDVDKVGMVAQ
jgi:hypothetical protein